MQNLLKTVEFVGKRFFHSSPATFKGKFSVTYPKHGPFPPDHPTVSYWPLPEHLDSQRWNYLKTPIPGRKVTRYVNILMQRDARRRETATYYGPLRHRLICLKKNLYLPDELRSMAAEEIVRLPKDSCRTRTINRCIVSSRPRGKRPRWRLSRMVFRKIADHGKMSGMERAFWSGGTQGHFVDLKAQTRKKKH